MEKYEYKMIESIAVTTSEDLILELNKEGEYGWFAVTAKKFYENDTYEYWEILFGRKCE